MDKASIQEALVSNFAVLLGSKSKGSQIDSNSASADDYTECLSEAVGFSDVVCTLPSMEMKVDPKSKDGTALPGVGSSFNGGSTSADKKPLMAASVLNASENSENASHMEKAAAQTLGAVTSWTKSTLVYAPQAASKSISSSFSSLVASRVKAWTLLLLRHSLTTGDAASRSRLLSMLSSNIEITSTTTSFKTLPLPDSAKAQPKEADVILPLLFETNLTITVQGRNDSVFLRAPGTIAGHFAKGDMPGLEKVDIRLDTNVLLESMVEQARLVVFKAVARATSVNVDGLTKPKEMQTGNSQNTNHNNSSSNHSMRAPSSNSLHHSSYQSSNGSSNSSNTNSQQNQNMSSFSSALNLSADAVANSPHLQKARSSALRLNSILQGKSSGGPSLSLHQSGGSKIRKTRSVQWDNALEAANGRSSNYNNNGAPNHSSQQQAPPSNNTNRFLQLTNNLQPPPAKRQRLVVQSQARLRSFKSFGRPHGGSVGGSSTEAKNATFGDFGRGPTMWGRDGKLMNHPRPGGGLAASRLSNLALDSDSQTSNQNATFDFSRGRSSRSNSNKPAMKRTATALESWLVNNATRR